MFSYRVRKGFVRYVLFVVLFVIPTGLFAQKVSLSGYMRDAETGESLIAGTIYVKEADQGAQTNTYGFYSVSVPPGKYTVIFSYVGYTPIMAEMDLSNNLTYNAELHSSTTMKEVEITSGRKDENVKNTEMGTISLSIAKIKQLPVLFGEVDILKT